jgi:hypothetical protein
LLWLCCEQQYARGNGFEAEFLVEVLLAQRPYGVLDESANGGVLLGQGIVRRNG